MILSRVLLPGYETYFVAFVYAESDALEEHTVAVAFGQTLDLEI